MVRTAIDRLWKPSYFYRPGLIPRRLFASRLSLVQLPWGMQLAVFPSEVISNGIARRGIHELPVTEAIYRLVRPGDSAVDVGANVGYFTSLMAFRVGTDGRVYAFEPHPQVSRRLQQNAARWNHPAVRINLVAVSSRTGTAHMSEPEEFSRNMGTASLSTAGAPVQATTLNDALPRHAIRVLKIDAEGHELAVLEGASQLFAEGLIESVIFEEHSSFTRVSSLLEDHGFQMFGFEERRRGVRLVEPMRASHGWDAPIFLATRDPEDVLQRVRADGWRCLQRRRLKRGLLY